MYFILLHPINNRKENSIQKFSDSTYFIDLNHLSKKSAFYSYKKDKLGSLTLGISPILTKGNM